MKLRALAIIAAFAVASTPALAETRPQPKGPPKTMGDEGVLPSTSTMGSEVPHMGTAEPAQPGSGAATQKGGPPKRMGDEGKLPATNNMSGQVPDMGGSK